MVQYKEKESFFACEMMDPNSTIEQKFDFSDKEQCDECKMFQMFQEDAKIVTKMDNPGWPKLKSEDEQSINT